MNKTCKTCKRSWGFHLLTDKADQGICMHPDSENFTKDIHEDDRCDLWEEESNGK